MTFWYMLNNLQLLNLVCFGVASGINLLVNRDIKSALLTGLISVFACCVGVFVVNNMQRIQYKPIINNIKAQINLLEKRQIELQQTVGAIATEKHHLQVKINYLKLELSALYTQISEQRTYQQQLSQDIIYLTNDRKHLATTVQELQKQVDYCEQCEAALYKSLSSIKQEKQDAQAYCNLLQAQTDQLQAKIIEIQNQKQEIEHDLAIIKELKPQIKDNLDQLLQTQKLDKETAQLKLSLVGSLNKNKLQNN